MNEKQLHFDYFMEIKYSIPVTVCHFTIKCIPKEDARQKLHGLRISLQPEVSYLRGEDSFGNRQIYGCVGEVHDCFRFHIEGEVSIGQILYEEVAKEELAGLYRYPYGKCIPGSSLLQYYRSIPLEKYLNAYEKCLYIMHRLHQDFSYVPGATGVSTDAETAWCQRKGVCQDYAHIMVVLLRLAGISARYVCGLIFGEGASHAWVEALCNGKWVGFDPTNDCLVADAHIKLGDGRDASDCTINRGIMRGGGEQTQKICVSVEQNGY